MCYSLQEKSHHLAACDTDSIVNIREVVTTTEVYKSAQMLRHFILPPSPVRPLSFLDGGPSLSFERKVMIVRLNIELLYSSKLDWTF